MVIYDLRVLRCVLMEHEYNSGGARGGLEGATTPGRKHLTPPSEDILGSYPRKFGENWENDVRKLHFTVILAPCQKLQPLCRKISSANPRRTNVFLENASDQSSTSVMAKKTFAQNSSTLNRYRQISDN